MKVLERNLDAIPDLVYFSTQRLHTALGVGNGTFQASTSVTAETSGNLVTGYVNNDLVPDVILVNHSLEKLFPYLGNGTGSFTATPAVAYVPTEAGFDVGTTLVDLDADGNRDLILSEQWTTTVFRGNGTGGFTRMQRYLARTDAVADMTGDGRVDLVTAPASITPGTSTSAFLAPTELLGMTYSSADLYDATADFDGNGRKDYVLFGQPGAALVDGHPPPPRYPGSPAALATSTCAPCIRFPSTANPRSSSDIAASSSPSKAGAGRRVITTATGALPRCSPAGHAVHPSSGRVLPSCRLIRARSSCRSLSPGADQ